MKKIFLSLAVAGITYFQASAQGNLLIVHNSPDPAAGTVDLWAEAPSVGVYTKLVDDITYKQAYFYQAPALPGSFTVHVKASNSSASSDPDLFSKSFSSVPTGNTLVVADGLVTPALVTGKPNPSGVSNAFDIEVKNGGILFSSANSNEAALAFHHGVVDLDSVYVQSFITTIQAPARDVLTAMSRFRDFTSSAQVPAASRRIHTIRYGQPQTNPVYRANGDALKGLGGKGVFVIATGFADTTGTGTSNTVKLLAYVTDATTTNGFVTPVEIPAEKIAGVVQVYHNAADPAVKNLDLYVGGMKQVLGLSFRNGFQSAGFIQDFDYNIDLHQKDSSASALSATLRLTSDSVVAVVSGVLDTTKFVSNPDHQNRKFQMYLNPGAQVSMPAGYTKITVFHGATDAPTVNLTVPAVGGAALISNLSYGHFQTASVTGLGSSLPTTLGTVMVDVRIPGGVLYKSYLVPLAALDGKAVTACASGFLDTTAANMNGASFKIFAGIPSAPFPQIVFLKDTSIVNSINDPATADLQFRMFPVPAANEMVMAFDVNETANVAIDIMDLSGRVVKNVTNDSFNKGTASFRVDVRDIQSGMYLARLTNGAKVSTYRFNVVK